MSIFFKATADRKREVFPSMIKSWQWYHTILHNTDEWLWYTIPRKKLFHPCTYGNNHETCFDTPTSSVFIPPSATLLDVASNDEWNVVMYVITVMLVIIVLYFVYIVYHQTHNNQWFDWVTGTEMFEFVAML